MAKYPTTWILIADGHRAGIYCNKGPGTGLIPLPDQNFEHALPPDRDLAADRAGSARGSNGSAHHALDHNEDLHRHEKAVFAKVLAQHVHTAAHNGQFNRLFVVAPPQALGDLRAAFSDGVRSTICGELAKDLTKIPKAELPSHFIGLLAL